MSITQRHKDALDNYLYITGKYGDPDDFTGSNAESDGLQALLKNPSKKKAAELTEEWVVSVIQNGGEGDVKADLSDPKTREIAILYDAIEID